ncbi:MAG TPA: hypothetical protein VLF19_12180 [Methylomirabilota bacterium]|nr:hypothetical protein [Methylomirabilota bacterium]
MTDTTPSGARPRFGVGSYISRCYGSLTTFNVLFGAAEGQLEGQGDRE